MNKCNFVENMPLDSSDKPAFSDELKNVFGFSNTIKPFSEVGKIIECSNKYKLTDKAFASILSNFNKILITSYNLTILDPANTVITAGISGSSNPSNLDLFVNGARVSALATPITVAPQPVPVACDIITSPDPVIEAEIESEIESRILKEDELLNENYINKNW